MTAAPFDSATVLEPATPLDAAQPADATNATTATALRPATLLTVWALFVVSGAAALIYEIVWFQMLQLVIGSSAISLGLLLATFMGGMGGGSLLLARWVPRRRHPLRVYAALELGIGLLAMAVLFSVPYLGHWYTVVSAPGMSGIFLRGCLCAGSLLPPTLLLGATLPAIARWVESSPRGMARLGYFYAGNTVGAVGGCLLAGFYLLRVFDIATATYVAAAMNLTVALVAWRLAARLPYQATETCSVAGKDLAATAVWPVYATIALSGFTALGAEVVWTRLLSLLLGGTTYTFSLILAMFLLGLGLGSSVGAWASGRLRDARLALGGCQLLLIAALAWTAWVITSAFPLLSLEREDLAMVFGSYVWDLARVAEAVLPATLLWGASFPLALAAAARPGDEPGRLVGRVLAANTLGAIVGALTFSLLLIPEIGTQASQRLLVAVALLAASVALVPGIWRQATRKRWLTSAALTSGLTLAIVLAWALPAMPFKILAHGRLAGQVTGAVSELYRGEGLNSTVAVSESIDGSRTFHISGKAEASTHPEDMRTQAHVGSLPAILHPQPKSALVVGFGAGVTSGSLLTFLDVERIVICELEPLVPQVVSTYFADQNFNVLSYPKVEVIYDDARHYMQTAHEKFDIITSDPIHPWVKGAASLYTREYFEQVRARLKPGGLATQWVPLYESNFAAVKSELATFFQVFPYGSVWTNARYGVSYDLILIGSAEPMTVNIDAIDHRLRRPYHTLAMRSLHLVGFDSPYDVLATFAGQAADLAPWLSTGEINCDRSLRLQYLAGKTPRGHEYRKIHDELLSYRKVSEDFFVGSAESRDKLRAVLAESPLRAAHATPSEPDDDNTDKDAATAPPGN